jgi:putative endonuclease
MSKSLDADWSIYIVECSTGDLYTGISKDVKARVDKHNQGKGAKFTKGRRPVKLVYSEQGLTHTQALRREFAIKGLKRVEKLEMIELVK